MTPPNTLTEFDASLSVPFFLLGILHFCFCILLLLLLPPCFLFLFLRIFGLVHDNFFGGGTHVFCFPRLLFQHDISTTTNAADWLPAPPFVCRISFAEDAPSSCRTLLGFAYTPVSALRQPPRHAPSSAPDAAAPMTGAANRGPGRAGTGEGTRDGAVHGCLVTDGDGFKGTNWYLVGV